MYSLKSDSAFCFPYRVFKHCSGINIGQNQILRFGTKNGFSNWKMASRKFKLHQSTKSRLNSVTSMINVLNSKSIDVSTFNGEKQKAA